MLRWKGKSWKRVILTREEQADDPETSLLASAQAEALATTNPQSEQSTADSVPSAQDDVQPMQQEDFSKFGPKIDLLPSLSLSQDPSLRTGRPLREISWQSHYS